MTVYMFYDQTDHMFVDMVSKTFMFQSDSNMSHVIVIAPNAYIWHKLFNQKVKINKYMGS